MTDLAIQAQSPASWGTQGWMLVGAIVVVAVVGALAFALKGWQWLEPPLTNVIVRVLGSKDIVERQTDEMDQVAQECIARHNKADDAHGLKIGALREWVRAEMVERIEEHDESRKAHIEALGPYVTLADFNGAILRMEAKVESSIRLVIERLDGITRELRGSKRGDYETPSSKRDG